MRWWRTGLVLSTAASTCETLGQAGQQGASGANRTPAEAHRRRDREASPKRGDPQAPVRDPDLDLGLLQRHGGGTHRSHAPTGHNDRPPSRQPRRAGSADPGVRYLEGAQLHPGWKGQGSPDPLHACAGRYLRQSRPRTEVRRAPRSREAAQGRHHGRHEKARRPRQRPRAAGSPVDARTVRHRLMVTRHLCPRTSSLWSHDSPTHFALETRRVLMLICRWTNARNRLTSIRTFTILPLLARQRLRRRAAMTQTGDQSASRGGGR